MYHNYSDIKRAKKQCEQLALELHDKYSSQITYREKLPDGGYRRPVIILQSQEQLDDVMAVRDQIATIRENVLKQSGSAPRFTEPRIISDVLLYKVYVSVEMSSTYSKTSRSDIIQNITERINRAARLDTDIGLMTAMLLKRELNFFQNEKEEFYRARTIGMPSSMAECHLPNYGMERLKISESGLFVVGVDFKTPNAEFPSGSKPRKRRSSIYDGLEEIQYSGAVNSILYRESDVNAAKVKAGFDKEAQQKIVDSKKKISRRRPGAPPEHPI